jgi:hypothetical protein
MVYHPIECVVHTLNGRQEDKQVNIVGVDNDEGPPVPIPNTEVKLISAYDTWLVTARENWSMPTLLQGQR